jgi:hypothetical protein
MSVHRPTFSVQALKRRPGYVAVATWPNGKSEQLGSIIYFSKASAEEWIRVRSALWLASRGFQDHRGIFLSL